MKAPLAANLLGITVLAATSCPGSDLAQIESTLSEARSALASKQFARARVGFGLLLKEAPEHPTFQTGLAQSLVGLGRNDEAQRVFRNLVAEGYGPSLLGLPAFQKLRQMPTQSRLISQAQAQTIAYAPAKQAFQISDPRFIAEGVAFDPATRRFFVSSTYLRKVTAVEPDGSQFDFIPAADHGLLQVLGMKTDRGRLLLLTGADDMRYAGADPRARNKTAIFQYDLRTGDFLDAAWLDEPGDHLFNDLVIGPQGEAYITDSTAGRIYRFEHGQFEPLTSSGSLVYPNGIDLDASRQILYVADVRGVFLLDLRTRSLSRLRSRGGASCTALDGLYLHRGWLIGVQGDHANERVAAFELSKNGRRIVGWKALERSDARLSEPTEGVLVGDELYFVANSNMQFVDESGQVSAEAKKHPISILRLPL